MAPEEACRIPLEGGPLGMSSPASLRLDSRELLKDKWLRLSKNAS